MLANMASHLPDVLFLLLLSSFSFVLQFRWFLLLPLSSYILQCISCHHLIHCVFHLTRCRVRSRSLTGVLIYIFHTTM